MDPVQGEWLQFSRFPTQKSTDVKAAWDGFPNLPVQCAEPRFQFLQESSGLQRERNEGPTLGPNLGPTLRSELLWTAPICPELTRSSAKAKCRQVIENAANYS